VLFLARAAQLAIGAHTGPSLRPQIGHSKTAPRPQLGPKWPETSGLCAATCVPHVCPFGASAASKWPARVAKSEWHPSEPAGEWRRSFGRAGRPSATLERRCNGPKRPSYAARSVHSRDLRAAAPPGSPPPLRLTHAHGRPALSAASSQRPGAPSQIAHRLCWPLAARPSATRARELPPATLLWTARRQPGTTLRPPFPVLSGPTGGSAPPGVRSACATRTCTRRARTPAASYARPFTQYGPTLGPPMRVCSLLGSVDARARAGGHASWPLGHRKAPQLSCGATRAPAEQKGYEGWSTSLSYSLQWRALAHLVVRVRTARTTNKFAARRTPAMPRGPPLCAGCHSQRASPKGRL